MGVEIVLTRWWTDCDVQLGRLVYPGGSCFTLEDRWLWNRVSMSCIPAGFYEIQRDTFRGEYENFKVLNVVGRTAIEIHRGNTDQDTEGCILLGEFLKFTPGAALAGSKVAFERFMKAMDGVQRALLAIIGPMEHILGMEVRHG